MEKNNVLIIGSGGREHSIALKVSQSPYLGELYAIPGNPGISELASCHEIDVMDNDAVVRFAKEKAIDIVIVGPEDPLANGIADAFLRENIKVFGPRKEAAQFESSKAFARNFMEKHGLPSAEFREFTDYEAASSYIMEKGAPIVIKADGLAAGKGVHVARDTDSALEFARECLEGRFGRASSKIVVEECLEGEEVSYLVFMDSETYKPMIYSQDHKPVGEGDTGPNTGGMGTYSPAPILEGYEKELEEKIMMPFMQGIREEGIEYSGVLYVGLMKTDKGLRILEFNVRFGDPETQVILPRLETDLIEIVKACADDRLKDVSISWKDEHCICVVLASGGYPGQYEKGKLIKGTEDVEDVQIIHAGTRKEEGHLYTKGGRVLNVVALGKSLREAYDKAYKEIEKISFEGMYYRKDIGKKELSRN